jgi:hypothetical protein
MAGHEKFMTFRAFFLELGAWPDDLRPKSGGNQHGGLK